MSAPEAAGPAYPDPEAVAAQVDALDLDHFGHEDAWWLGQAYARIAAERSLRCTVAVWRGEQRVFQHARPGTSADNDGWTQRKRAVVTRYDAASLQVTLRWRALGVSDVTLVGLDPARHVLSGGGVPVRVHGAPVGVVVVSGMHEVEDHELAVEGLALLRDALAADPGRTSR